MITASVAGIAVTIDTITGFVPVACGGVCATAAVVDRARLTDLTNFVSAG